MPLKVTWKKGMRLNTEVFDALDSTIADNIRLTALLAAGGRYGLFPASKPFGLSVNINNSILEVVSLSCHGITASGKLVDIDFDSNYTVTFDTRIPFPAADGSEAYILAVRMHDWEWREVNEMYSEPLYTFELLGENTIVGNDSLPIGRIVNQYGWRLDETGYVPPCIYVETHPKFMELLERAKSLFKAISDRCLGARDCVARHLLSAVWSQTASGWISLDKERGALSPGALLAWVQKVVNAFVTGCFTDSYITLENADEFVAYLQTPYDARHICRDIERGLDLCAEISVKMGVVCEMTEIREAPAPKPAPKPAPRPAPAVPEPPTPQEDPRRKRWEGIEI